jgi:hypothetical protein
MKLFNSLLLTAGLAVATYSSAINAADEFILCDSCSSYSDYESRAASLPYEEGETYILIANFENEEIKRFRRYFRAGNPSYGEPGIVTLSQAAIPSNTQSDFNVAMQAKNNIEEFFDIYGDIPSNIAESAYDLGGNQVLQREVANYYANNQSLQQYVGNYTSMIALIAGKIVNINLYVSVRFSDGSFADYAVKGLKNDLTIEFEFSRGYDKYGNEVPESLDALEGTFKFDSVLYNSFSRTVTRFDLVLRGPTIEGGQVIIKDCSLITVGSQEVLDCPPVGYD